MLQYDSKIYFYQNFRWRGEHFQHFRHKYPIKNKVPKRVGNFTNQRIIKQKFCRRETRRKKYDALSRVILENLSKKRTLYHPKAKKKMSSFIRSIVTSPCVHVCTCACICGGKKKSSSLANFSTLTQFFPSFLAVDENQLHVDETYVI